MLALTLWDTGCSHEIITPVFAEELLRKGARWRECIPLHLSHGNAEHVTAAAPPSRQVCANILLVHKGEIFEQRDVYAPECSRLNLLGQTAGLLRSGSVGGSQGMITRGGGGGGVARGDVSLCRPHMCSHVRSPKTEVLGAV